MTRGSAWLGFDPKIKMTTIRKSPRSVRTKRESFGRIWQGASVKRRAGGSSPDTGERQATWAGMAAPAGSRPATGTSRGVWLTGCRRRGRRMVAPAGSRPRAHVAPCPRRNAGRLATQTPLLPVNATRANGGPSGWHLSGSGGAADAHRRTRRRRSCGQPRPAAWGRVGRDAGITCRIAGAVQLPRVVEAGEKMAWEWA